MKNVKLEGKVRMLPFNNLELFNNKIKNLGYVLEDIEDDEGWVIGMRSITLYEYEGKTYMVDSIYHDNENLISVDLKEYE